jgi:hypothetical protein
MRVQRTLQLALVFAAVTVVAACASSGRGYSEPGYSATGQWDSGPLDADYQRQRGDMDGRHAQEIANPRPDESADQRSQRQDSENKDLDTRYAQGKASHAQSVPAAAHDDGHADNSHQ